MPIETPQTEQPQENLTVSEMTKTQELAFTQRTMVTLNILERLGRLEKIVELIKK